MEPPLEDRHCTPCRGKVPPMEADAVAEGLARLEDWAAPGGRRLTRSYKFKDFASALAFVNRIAEVAEAERHHPDLLLRWGEVRVELWTHKIDALTENDFILAAKIDRLPR